MIRTPRNGARPRGFDHVLEGRDVETPVPTRRRRNPVTATKPTSARWNNTGGDVTIHIVPAGTPLLVNPTQEEVWAYSSQVTTPICGLLTAHGSWTYISRQVAPLTLCSRCFA